MKTCTKCGETKDESEFIIRTDQKPGEDGLPERRKQCKTCRKTWRVGRAKDIAPKISTQKSAWRRANPELYAAQKGRNIEKVRQHRVTLAGRPQPADGLCEVCRRPPTGRGGLHWDHDHKTGLFRGWICHACNVSLGLLGDSILILLKLAWYVFKHRWFRGRC